MRKCMCMGVALVLSVAVAACGGGKGQSGGSASTGSLGSSKSYPEFRLGEMDWPGSISFKINGWQQAGQIESLVVQGLVEMGPSEKPKLGLASSVEHPNPTTYIYHIRSGVKFSDGKPLTVADVVYSLNLNKGKLFSNIKEPWETVSSVSAQNGSAVVVKLKRPSPEWENIMVMASGIVEKATTEKLSETEIGMQHGLLIGTGPWKFDSYIPEMSVALSRNPYWTGPRAPAAKIAVTVFKNEAEMALALRSGAIDAASVYGSQKLFGQIPGTHQEVAGAQNWISWVSMNTSAPPLNDVHVRRAIAYATDVKGMIKALYPDGGASPDPSVIPIPLLAELGSTSEVSNIVGAIPKYEFDLAKARQELAKSAYPHGFTTEVKALVAEPILLNAAQIIAADLAKIGITVKVKPLQVDEDTVPIVHAQMFANEYLSYVPNEPGAMMSTLLSPSNIYPGGNGFNLARYKNPQVARLVTEVKNTVNRPQRLRAAGHTLNTTAGEEPYLPLFMHSIFLAVSNRFVSPPFSFYTAVYSPWMLNMKLAH